MTYYGGVDGSADLEVDFDKNVTSLYESISESDWDVALSDVRNNPDEAKTWVVRYEDGSIMWRFLPIHSACARQPPEDVINSLIGAYRQGAQCRDDQGMLPLHYACGNQASVDVIRILLLAYPDGANVADPNGMLPLHYIAQWGPSTIDAIDVLLFANRNALEARDKEGNTPFLLARDGEYDERERKQVLQALERFMFPSHSSSNNDNSNNEPVPPRFNPSHVTMHNDSDPPRKDNQQMQPQQQQDSPSSSTLRSVEQQPQDGMKGFTSMPKTSDAVRRLQEAAAAQQLARSTYLKASSDSVGIPDEHRDDDTLGSTILSRSIYGSSQRDERTSSNNIGFSSFNNNSNIKSSLKSTTSMDDTGTAYTMDSTSQRIVSSLKAEVEKLRTEASTAESEAQRQINSERAEMQKAIDEMKAKLAKCEKETTESLLELTAKEEFGQYVESRLKEKENELKSVMNRNGTLRDDLDSMKKNVAKYKDKTNKLNEHLEALAKSIGSMMEEQDQILNASKKHEAHMKDVSLSRQQKMQELIDQEVNFARLSLEKQKQSDLGSEEMINAALESQKKLMASVVGVLVPNMAHEG